MRDEWRIAEQSSSPKVSQLALGVRGVKGGGEEEYLTAQWLSIEGEGREEKTLKKSK